MRKRLIIAGAGGFGREIAALAETMPDQEWDVYGFFDSNPDALNGFEIDLPIITDLKNFDRRESDVFICAIGSPTTRRKVVEEMITQGCEFVRFVHPRAYVGPRCQIGIGAVIYPHVTLVCDIRIGSHAVVNIGSTVNHDAKIGDFAVLSPQCAVPGGVILGEGCLMGTNAIILPRVRIGKNCVLGAGSVSVKDVPDNTTVVGIPARPIQKR